nr:hypothetical protein [Tanacetum cinerariifolium]
KMLLVLSLRLLAIALLIKALVLLKGATVIKLNDISSSSKHESKKHKLKGPRRTSAWGSIPPLSITAPKGVRKHPQVLAWHLGSSEGSLEPLVPEVYSAHNVLSGLHHPFLENKLDSLCLDDLANVYDVHALNLAMIGNMLTNESRVVSCDYSKLKSDFVSFRSKNGLLEHEMSKLEDSLSRPRKNQDVEREVKRLGKKCLEVERESLLSKESSFREEVNALSFMLKIADLEKIAGSR